MKDLSFAGRVVLVTGAGAGLGRAHANYFAARGAHVVVNDIGVSVHGEACESSVAEDVAAAIRSTGGSALANMDSVATAAGADSMVQQALDVFGRLDVVVNNAGILRDATIANATPDDVDAILKVHLVGSFNVVRSAWPALVDSGCGAIVNTSSNSGLLGNFGQAAYGAAKMGLVGFTRVLAIEGKRRSIRANAIAPMAHTRMTGNVLGDDASLLAPDQVAPVVAWLAHESCELTGEVLTCGGGHVGRYVVGITQGWTGDDIEMEDVAENQEAICDDSNLRHFDAGAGEVAALLANLRERRTP